MLNNLCSSRQSSHPRWLKPLAPPLPPPSGLADTILHKTLVKGTHRPLTSFPSALFSVGLVCSRQWLLSLSL